MFPFRLSFTMVEANGSESFPNATNQTLHSLERCSGSYPPISVRITIYSILMIFSLIGNLMVIAVFYRNRTLRTVVHYFIVNMAISDLIVPVITLPWVISETYLDGLWLVDGVLGTILCKIEYIAWGSSTFISILSMIGTAADRFHAVLFPMRSVLLSQTKCQWIISATWVLSVVFRAHFLYGAEVVSNGIGFQCTLQWEPASYKWEVFRINWILLFGLTSISAIVLTVLYSSIILFLHRQKNNLHLATEVIKLRAKENRQVTRMLVIIVVLFYAVWTPYHVAYGISKLTPFVKIPCLYFWLCDELPLLYPVVNPVVYYIFNANYRQGFREVLCCPRSCSKRCNDCFHSSVSPQDENNVDNAEQMNNAMENIELQENR